MTFKIEKWITDRLGQEVEEKTPSPKIDVKSELNQKRIPKNKAE